MNHAQKKATFALFVVLAASCKPREQGTGLVTDAAVTPTVAPIEAGPIALDPGQCGGCQNAPAVAWTFEGIYRDSQCTEPLAQATVAMCAQVPALGQTSMTYVDEVGLRKANETAQVTLTEQIPPDTTRYRKSDSKKCVAANEAATHVTPMSCAGQKVCRDQSGALACAACRTMTNGCADYEDTRLYAKIDDPGLKAKAAAGGNLARLHQCCAALAAEARRMGPSPEAGLLTAAAAQCQVLVSQAGPNGTAPELGAIRNLLAGRNVPAVCQGF